MEQLSKELIQRLSIAILGIPALLCIFYCGGLPLMIFMVLLTAISLWEYKNIVTGGFDLSYILDLFPTLLMFFLASFYNSYHISWSKLFVVLLIIVGIRTFYWAVVESGHKSARVYLLTLMGWIYIGLFSGLIYRLGLEYHNQRILLLLLIFIWITDSAAYFIGMSFGKHRGIFPVSPKKSLEGFLAGIVIPLVLALAVARYFHFWTADVLMLTALCAGVLGQIGDLTESKIKRIGGVKDSSDLIPGHGGFLDRFDSLLIAGPALYILLKIIP